MRRHGLLGGTGVARCRSLPRVHPTLEFVAWFGAHPGAERPADFQGSRSDPARRPGRGGAFMIAVPLWLQTAFADWLSRRLYVDGCGNYRSRVLCRRVIPYNRALKYLYP